MTLRRSAAVFFTLLFLVFSLGMFFVLALANTFLKPAFYQGPVKAGTYDFLINVSAERILASDKLIVNNFNVTDLRTEISSVFTRELFDKMVDNFSLQIDNLKMNPSQPLVISLKLFRESLLTVARNLAFRLFKTLPVCSEGQIPEQNVQGIPSCVPKDVEFNAVAEPFSGRFEKAVYSSVPDQIQYDLNGSGQRGPNGVAALFKWISLVRYFLYGGLLTLLVLIALLVYAPFVDILKYEGMAFALSGALGLLLGLGIETLPGLMLDQAGIPGIMHSQTLNYVQYLFSFLTAEVQKIALIFFAFGAILILMQTFLKRKS